VTVTSATCFLSNRVHHKCVQYVYHTCTYMNVTDDLQHITHPTTRPM
jgi:hypothetical protein